MRMQVDDCEILQNLHDLPPGRSRPTSPWYPDNWCTGSPCFNTVSEKCSSGFMEFWMYTTASGTQRQLSHFSLHVVHFVGGVVKFLLHHGRRIYLGSILVIAREKELWHNLGARSQLIWPRWRRNSEGSSRPPFLWFQEACMQCVGGRVCACVIPIPAFCKTLQFRH